ncbi:MAG TPA: PilZ domain-containing protein [Pirellulales bacterium]|jgi:hypothetical protein|nr:PilZ domain-containing protein [Pirellulales bacterium]
MAMQKGVDAAFYKQVHRHISQALENGDERRNERHRGARCIQRIAPCVDGRLPVLAAFREVECQDLSAGGFTCLLPEPPEIETMAVELGAPPVLIYVTARVVHVSESRLGEEIKYLVGCRFTGRLDSNEAVAEAVASH